MTLPGPDCYRFRSMGVSGDDAGGAEGAGSGGAVCQAMVKNGPGQGSVNGGRGNGWVVGNRPWQVRRAVGDRRSRSYWVDPGAGDVRARRDPAAEDGGFEFRSKRLDLPGAGDTA